MPGLVGELDGLVRLEQNRGDFEVELEVHGVPHRFQKVPEHVVPPLLHAQHKQLDEALLAEAFFDRASLRLDSLQHGVEVEGVDQALQAHLLENRRAGSEPTFRSENFSRGIVRVLYCVKTRKMRRRHRITTSFRV